MKRQILDEIWLNLRSSVLSACFILAVLPSAHAQNVASTSAPSQDSSVTNHVESANEILAEAYQYLIKGNLDFALQKVDSEINIDSQNIPAHLMRAGIYAQQNKWEDAGREYQLILAIDPNNAIAKFDMADLKFLQKKYDAARQGFVELEHDKDLGDLSTYKVFLCDLFAAHEDVAATDLQALDGGNPSYYFGNAAWDIAHHKSEDAASWLKSAAYIYASSPQKLSKYATSLASVGYLPIHLSSAQ